MGYGWRHFAKCAFPIDTYNARPPKSIAAMSKDKVPWPILTERGRVLKPDYLTGTNLSYSVGLDSSVQGPFHTESGYKETPPNAQVYDGEMFGEDVDPRWLQAHKISFSRALAKIREKLERQLFPTTLSYFNLPRHMKLRGFGGKLPEEDLKEAAKEYHKEMFGRTNMTDRASSSASGWR